MTKSRDLGNLVSDGASSGVAVYATIDAMTSVASPSAGDLAYVTANTSLYQNNGNGWYKIATINTSPAIGSVSETTSGSTTALTDNGTFTLTAGSNTVVTITASDTDPGTDLTYTKTVTSGTASNVATITQGTGASENVFTFAPATSVGGTITVRFDVTDNTNTAQFTNSFELSFIPSWDQSASVMYSTWPSTVYSDTFYTGGIIGGFWFNSTGTKMIVSDSANATYNTTGRLKEYTLNPAWDHTSATFSQNGDQYIYANNGFDLTGDGMTVVYGDTSDYVKYTNLSTAFDISVRNGTRQNGPNVSMTVRDVKFSYDGSKLFVLHGSSSTNAQIWTYDLSTDYDISSTSATRDTSNSWTPNSSWNEMLWTSHFQFNPTGTRLYAVSTGYHNFTSWTLTTAWDLSTIGSKVEGGNLYVSNIKRFFIRPDTGDEVYVSNDSTAGSGSQTQTIYSRRDS
jgi:hypothetical protein